MKAVVPCVCLILCFASVDHLHAQAPSYTKDVRPFLNNYCIQCHQGKKSRGGINLGSYETIMKGGRRDRKLVVANDADKSLLATCVEGKGGRKMPPEKAAKHPTAKETSVLRDWINAGAKDDTAKDPADPVKDKQDAEKQTGKAVQTWTRVEEFDLPVRAQVITATKNLSTRSLTLSNHKVMK